MSEILAILGFGSFVSLTVILMVIWIIFWKGWATWIAARKNQRIWFIVLLVVNTLGILEILYIFLFSKIKPKPKVKKGDEITVEPLKSDSVKELQ